MSDQDFFFDEDEKPAAKSQNKGTAAKGTPSGAKSNRPAPKGAAPTAQSVTYTVAALIGVAALLLGVIIGILLPINVGSATTATPDAGLTSTPGQTQAPALTNEQMQSGQLPAGHPAIGGSSGTTGSATTTP